MSGILLLGLVFSSTSCSKDDDVIQTRVYSTEVITVLAKDWVWHEDDKLYEKIFRLDELTEHIFDYGSIVAYQWYNDYSKTPLPVTQAVYYQDANGDIRTREYNKILTLDYFLNSPSTVRFCLQFDDKQQHDPEDASFQIVFVWN
ncbi:MAG TPA: hypothetical protein DDZ96_09720 [Porphyromonadaceae bacterium]|nr:hypothetical protein [Porphyromonadaceae bacterium]HBK30451.1 hypothetical protein [Porphyromonadaceae bacterium]HBL34076.1 hypothetical protein [Porphyromonadaceae bacterium]HBX21460.1 hypothetical protein [Porphyromonadaceae bacterium]HCM19502.1 hypothetical protein [Porphyromonadaceae bacterium]